MATELTNVLKKKLAAYEGAGMTEQAAAVKAKLAEVRKAGRKADKVEAEAEPAPKAASKKETT